MQCIERAAVLGWGDDLHRPALGGAGGVVREALHLDDAVRRRDPADRGELGGRGCLLRAVAAADQSLAVSEGRQVLPLGLVRHRRDEQGERDGARDGTEDRGDGRGCAATVPGGITQRQPGCQRKEATELCCGTDDRGRGDDQAELRQHRAGEDERRNHAKHPRVGVVLALYGEREGPAAEGECRPDRCGDQPDDREPAPCAQDTSSSTEGGDDVLPGGGARRQHGGDQAGHDADKGQGGQLQRPDVRGEQESVEAVGGDEDCGDSAERAGDDADQAAEGTEDQALPEDDGAHLSPPRSGRGQQPEGTALPTHPDGEGRTREQSHLRYR